ncbi:hypothetical protein BK816_04730 [Boudabousia tangfeifanii]|uniref:Phosphodiesterase n=1 Tax=Boudabousia tangfeifanii TaxID=1912795 RepID=A0A1D9MKJ0_9ACTO|nr:DUF5998 family protein [Boudabousia tangfeifanii]AOZ72680.1 hypothetical protein BK816_04730 [Boudabousia tangfeifanii]
MIELPDSLIQDINRAGVHPKQLMHSLQRALGTQTLRGWLVQVMTDLDSMEIFRHVTVAAFSDTHFFRAHVDEEDAEAMISVEVVSLPRIHTYLVADAYDTKLPDSEQLSELSLRLNWGSIRRFGLDPNQCSDPSCDADHGYQGVSTPDDLLLIAKRNVDGPEEIAKMEDFIAQLLPRLLAASK